MKNKLSTNQLISINGKKGEVYKTKASVRPEFSRVLNGVTKKYNSALKELAKR